MSEEHFSDDHRPSDPSDAFPTADQALDAACRTTVSDNDIFFDDPVLADGTNLRRGMEQLIEELDAVRFDASVVWEVPRLFRTELTRGRHGRRRGLLAGSAQASPCGDDAAMGDAGADAGPHDGGAS